MPQSRHRKGTYDRVKTPKWDEQDGYSVAVIENTVGVWVDGNILYVPKDVCAADLLALKAEPPERIFMPSKTRQGDTSQAVPEVQTNPSPAPGVMWSGGSPAGRGAHVFLDTCEPVGLRRSMTLLQGPGADCTCSHSALLPTALAAVEEHADEKACESLARPGVPGAARAPRPLPVPGPAHLLSRGAAPRRGSASPLMASAPAGVCPVGIPSSPHPGRCLTRRGRTPHAPGWRGEVHGSTDGGSHCASEHGRSPLGRR